jgi:hypothetical protein
MDFNEIVKQETDKFIAEKLPNLVADKVAKMVDEILSNIFQSYSGTGKGIKEAIESQLNISLVEFKLSDYNAMISKAINDHIVKRVNEGSVEPILSLIDETIGVLAKKHYKISEIHKMCIEYARDESYDSSGEISFHVIENSEHGWHTICFDTDKNKSEENCAIEILISSDRKKIFSMKYKTYFIGKGSMTPFRIAALSRFEQIFFRMYSAQVTIEIDEYDFENQWYKYEN